MHVMKPWGKKKKPHYKNYLDFPAKVPLCLLVPISGKLLPAVFSGRISNKWRQPMGRMDEAHIAITKSLS